MSIKSEPSLAVVTAAFKEIENLIPDMLQELAVFSDARIAGITVGSFMENASSDPLLDPANPPPGPLKIRSGRLARAAASKPYRGAREFVINLSISEQAMKWVKTYFVPYAAIHEFGGVIHVPVTARMRRFFWAKFFETNNERWKFMAISNKTEFVIQIDARPFAGPGLQASAPSIAKEAERLLFGLIDSVLTRRLDS